MTQPSPGRRLHTAASVALLAAVCAAAAWFARGHWTEFRALALERPRVLVPLVALVPAMTVANGLQLRFLVRPFGVHLSPREWFGLAVITNFYNTITPFRGGLFAKAAYLKSRHELSLTGFVTVSAGITLANILGAGVIGLAGLASIRRPDGPGAALLAALFAAAIVGPVALMLFGLRLPTGRRPLWLRLARIVEGWQLIRGNGAVLWLTWCVTAFQYAIAAAATIWSFELIGVHVGVGASLFLTSLIALSGMIGITPAGLGIIEVAAVFAGLAVGITPAQSLATALSRRLITAAVTLPLGPLFTLSLLRAARVGDPAAARKRLTPPA